MTPSLPAATDRTESPFPIWTLLACLAGLLFMAGLWIFQLAEWRHESLRDGSASQAVFIGAAGCLYLGPLFTVAGLVRREGIVWFRVLAVVLNFAPFVILFACLGSSLEFIHR